MHLIIIYFDNLLYFMRYMFVIIYIYILILFDIFIYCLYLCCLLYQLINKIVEGIYLINYNDFDSILCFIRLMGYAILVIRVLLVIENIMGFII